MLCAKIMTKMDSLLLVLVVTSCCWLPVGSDEVLRKTNSSYSGSNVPADGVSQRNTTSNVMFAEVNSVASSTTESQGASSASEASPSPSMSPTGTKETINDDAVVRQRKGKSYNEDRDLPDSLSTSTSSSTSASPRTLRNGASPIRSGPNRDNKLMNLLAARRSALQRTPFRTHRRTSGTNRTSIESPFSPSSAPSSRSPNDTRSSCERNCTKNFTRRITASCIRRCLAQARTKVDEKDNNEILETDESSHGFFVIAKDLNDTVNHIGDGVKSSEASTEKISRVGVRPTGGLENVDIPPYLFFGQKLPPLRPNRKTNQTTESSQRHSTERGKTWNRNYQPRNFGSYSRFHSSRNVIRPTTTPVVTKPTADNSKAKLVKEDSEEDEPQTTSDLISKTEPVGNNATETILLRRPTEQPATTSTDGKTETITLASAKTTTTTASTVSTVSPTTLTTTSTTTETTTSSTSTTPSTTTTMNHTSAEPTSSSFIPTTTSYIFNNESLYTLQTVEAGIPPTVISTIETSTPPTSTSTQTTKTEPKSIETTLPPSPLPEDLAKIFDPIDEDKSNIIIFYKVTTQPSTLSSPNVFTRTTISSSVRSTVNPRVRPAPQTTSSVEYSLSSSTLEATTPQPEIKRENSGTHDRVTPSVHDVSGGTMLNGDVTIEVKQIHTATYILAGLGVFPIVIIILYVAKTIIFKRRYKDDDDLDQFTSDGKPISPVRKMDHLDDDNSDQYSIVTERDFERQNLRFKSLLGEGNFGQVWKAEADDLIGHMGTTRIVAVKTVRSGSTQVSLKEEAEIMRKLGSHSNVVTLLGACLETEPHLLIMEYAMRGRLLSLLRAARSATNILPASVPGGRSLAPLSPRTLAGFALDIARGMEYISEKKIVHRDLAARNILLDHNGVCKICDFGMSIDLERSRHSPVHAKKSDSLQQTQCFDTRFHFDFGGRWMSHWNNNNNNNNNDKKHNHDSVSKRPALPIRWMAPEALQYHIFSIKTDVWAFGIVLWEIATLGCTPYPNLSGREVIRSVPNGIRPELPQDGRPEFYDLMQRCWRKDPQLRPSFREARNEISRISCKWHDDDLATSDYMDVSGFSEDLEHGMVYFNRRISEFECEI